MQTTASQGRMLPPSWLAARSAASIARCQHSPLPQPPCICCGAAPHLAHADIWVQLLRDLIKCVLQLPCQLALQACVDEQRRWAATGGGPPATERRAAQGLGGALHSCQAAADTVQSPLPATALRPHIVCVQCDQPRLAIRQVLVEVQVWKGVRRGGRRGLSRAGRRRHGL